MLTETKRKELNWTSSDARALKEYLDKDTGRKFLAVLASELPQLLGKGETNEVLIRSGEARQHIYLTGLVLDLRGDTFVDDDLAKTSVPADSYPSLEDDSQWEGPSLHDPDNPNNN